MYFLIVISGPLSLEDYIFVPSHVQQMTCCLKFFATPNDDAEKRNEEARESEASGRKDVEKERTHIKSVNEITLVN